MHAVRVVTYDHEFQNLRLLKQCGGVHAFSSRCLVEEEGWGRDGCTISDCKIKRHISERRNQTFLLIDRRVNLPRSDDKLHTHTLTVRTHHYMEDGACIVLCQCIVYTALSCFVLTVQSIIVKNKINSRVFRA